MSSVIILPGPVHLVNFVVFNPPQRDGTGVFFSWRIYPGFYFAWHLSYVHTWLSRKIKVLEFLFFPIERSSIPSIHLMAEFLH
jgi:hypothetical protein